MIWKIVTMGKQEITVREEMIPIILEQANRGVKLILTDYGIVNTSSIDSIVPHKKKMEDVVELKKYHPDKTMREVEMELLEKSPFSEKLLSLAKNGNGTKSIEAPKI